MKKSIIKRRKRVVPALQDQSMPNSRSPPPQSSLSPDPSPAFHLEPGAEQRGTINPDGSVNLGFRQRESSNRTDTTYESSPRHPTPPVDFTDYRRSSSHAHHYPRLHAPTSDPSHPPTYPSPTQLPTSLPSHSPTSTRKRSRSRTQENDDSDRNRLSSISSILNHTQHDPHSQQQQQHQGAHPTTSASAEVEPDETDNIPIEPSLLALSNPQHHSQPPPAIDPALQGKPLTNGTHLAMEQTDRDRNRDKENERLERRARLNAEAEAMRELLRAKERELADLGDG